MIKFCRPGSLLLAGGMAMLGAVVVPTLAMPAAAAPVPASGTFHPTAPARILDTRSGVGVSLAAPIGAGNEVVLQVTGRSSVPVDASAAVLNVTVTAPTGIGFVTVYPDGSARPVTSNVNVVRNQTVPNLVVVQVPCNGRVRLFNGSTGTVQLIADASGYYLGASSPSGQGAFGALAPRRVLDTRVGTGAPKAAVATHASVAFTATGTPARHAQWLPCAPNARAGIPDQDPVGPGRGGVPLSSVGAFMLNVTVTASTAPGFLTVYGAPARRSSRT